jgi:D-glycero-D-manno-heptose 1,7-bisphosphate phosphatase
MDRDGTLIEEVNYLTRPEQVRLLPGAAGALRQAQDLGWRLAVVTNQSAVARGMLTEEGLGKVHRRLVDLLAEAGVKLDGIYYCPHLVDAPVEAYRSDCDCRKPKPGLLLQAARELGLDLSRSIMVGDTGKDLEAGRAAGCRTVLVLTGYGSSELANLEGPPPDHVAPDLMDAVRWAVDRA